MALPIFTYEIISRGPFKHIVAYKDDVVVYTSNELMNLSESEWVEKAVYSLMDGHYAWGGEAEQAIRAMKNKNAPIVNLAPDVSIAESPLPPINPPAPVVVPTPLSFTPLPTTKAPTTSQPTDQTKYRIFSGFDATIELDELSISAPEKSKGSTQKVENVVGVEYPLVKVNNYIFSRDELLNFEIESTGFLPTISIEAGFIDNLFLSKEMPKDGDIISIAIRNRSDTLKIIRNDYVITSVHVMPSQTQTKAPVIMTMYGELFVPMLKSQKDDYAFDGTTFEALQDIAKKLKLGFATNEDNTDDKQVWLKANIAGDIYINNLVERAWRDSQSFYACWIDVYYKLNFINLNKQLMSAESEIDVAALISNMDVNTNYDVDMSDKNTEITPKLFSNLTQFRATPFFINTWRPKNRSTSITFLLGTKMACELFEHNKNLYETEGSQNYWAVPIEPMYDNEKLKNSIIFRGRTSYVDASDNSDLKLANHPYVGMYEKYPWLGIQYTASDTTVPQTQRDGNHHRNYQVAKVNNLMNNRELDKMNVEINVNGNNFNIIRGDKVPVLIIRTDAVDNKRVNPKNNMSDQADLFFSGWFIVKGFNLSWSSDGNDEVYSNFVHQLILTRREWPAPIPIEAITDPVSPASNTMSSSSQDDDSTDDILVVNPNDVGLLNPIGHKVRLSSRFGPRKSPTPGGSSNHKGVDFAVPSGTPLYSPGDGTVQFAGDTSPNSCGGHVKIATGQYIIKMCHVRKWVVATGQKVKRGQLVGYSGGGKNDPYHGASTGAHLHYGVFNANGSVAYNPELAHKDIT